MRPDEPWPQFPLPEVPESTVSVSDFGAVGDGSTLNTEFFKAAIEKVHDSGGGTIQVPPGRWHTGPIHLKSRIRIHMEEKAEIVFTDDFNAYLPVVFTRFEGVECYNYSPLIYAKDCTDIAITGAGKLIGNGQAWWGWKKAFGNSTGDLYNMEGKGIPLSERVFGIENVYRPSFIQPLNCQRVLIEGISVESSPMWTIHPVYCRDVTVRGVNVHTAGPNTDGLNPDSCERVLIENCSFHTGDDCIAVNAGMNEDGWRVGKPCRDIYIQNCTGSRGHGGVVIGSAMSGGIENVYARNCSFTGLKMGIRLKAKRGRGGYVRNIHFENFTLTDIKQTAVIVDMYYPSGLKPLTETPPDFSAISIRKVSGNCLQTAVSLQGLPEQRLRDVHLEDIGLSGEQGLVCQDVDGLTLNHVRIRAATDPGIRLVRCRGIRTINVDTDLPLPASPGGVMTD